MEQEYYNNNYVDIKKGGILVSKTKKTENDFTIDELFYSRQLYVLGYDGMRGITNADVLISGAGGLGVEIAKNVILCGVNSLTLHDTAVCSWNDLSSQFYLSEADIGRNRAEATYAKLAQLNNYVHTKIYTGELTENFLRRFRVIVLTASDDYEQHRIAKIAHENKIALIIAETRGLFAKIFCDFGENFTIYEPDDFKPKSAIIADISSDTQGIVTCLGVCGHLLTDGDYVNFSEVHGMTELNECGPLKVRVLGTHTLSIGDTSQYGKYIAGGIATQIKMTKVLHFEQLETAEKKPKFLISDANTMVQSHTLHVAFKTLHKYILEVGKLPRPWNERDARRFLQMCKNVSTDVIDNVVLTFAKICAGNLSPFDAATGGFVAQELLKACSGKFTPIHQFFYYDAIECLPVDGVQDADAQPIGSRYDAQIAIFGQNFQQKVANARYLIVGAGAIGCELLKNFAMIGVGSGLKGEILIADMDIIEKSNLNRQFLFRLSDIQKPKAETAAKAIRKINPTVKVTTFDCAIGIDTEDVFSHLLAHLNGVAGAVDNVESRLYISNKCVFNHIPYVDSGVNSCKCAVQVVVPFVTDSFIPPLEQNAQSCTLTYFPNCIEHTLQWARDVFDEYFTQTPQNAAKCITNYRFLEQTPELSETQRSLKVMKKALIDEKPKNFSDCVKWARINWEEQYANNIKELLLNFPPNEMTQGKPFWSTPKRCPAPLVFDVHNSLHLDYIYAAANLRAEVYGIPQVYKRDIIADLVEKVKVPEFKDDNCGFIWEDAEVYDKYLKTLIAELKALKKFDCILNPLVFKSDDSNNLHIDFIMAASNLRAANYEILPAGRAKSIQIVAKIIPAISPTTSFVSGIAMLEVIKLIMGHKELSKFKMCIASLAKPHIGFLQPQAPFENIYNGRKWTLWDCFEVQGELTLQEFLDYFECNENLKITLLSHCNSMLYGNFMSQQIQQQRLPLPMTELVCNVLKRKIVPHECSLIFEMCCENGDGDNIEVPYVRYILN